MPLLKMPWLFQCRQRWRENIRLRHTVILSTIILVIMAIGSMVMLHEQRKMIREAAEARILAFSRTFALMGAAAVLDNLFRIQEAMGDYIEHPDILQIDVIDMDNMIVSAKNIDRIGKVLEASEWLVPIRSEIEAVNYIENSNGEPLLIVLEPIRENDEKIAAWIRVIVSLKRIRETELQIIQRMILVTLALMIAGIIGVHFSQRQVARVFRKIIEQLKDGLAFLGPTEPHESQDPIGVAGVKPTPRPPHPGEGEIEYLTEAVTQTIDLIKMQSHALGESRKLIQAVLDHATAVIYIKDTQGCYLLINRQFEMLFHTSKDQVVGKTDFDIFPRALADNFRANDLKIIEAGTPLQFEEIAPHDDGIHTYLSLKFPLRDDEGVIRSVCGISTDITERKRAEEAQKRFVAILEATPDFVGIADKEGHTLFLNHAGRTMIGIGETEQISNMVIENYHPDWSGQLIMSRGLPQAMREGVWSAETALLTRDGREIPVLQVILAHKNPEGEVEFYSTIARDISERKQTEAELQSLTIALEQKVKERTADLEIARDQALIATRHKSEFLANMSHELRTPLNAVIGFSEVLLERMFGDLNEKQEEYIQDILSSGRHLLALINEILDLSKIEAGRTELEMTMFDLVLMIENTLSLVRERATRHSIGLTSRIDKGLATCVGDERKLKQVLLNLLSNAIKFTQEGGTVTVEAQVKNNCVEVSVSDTGVGISQEDQSKIFEEFYQAKEKVIQQREGTGLGLALAKKYVELHDGKIWVKSEVGRGSTFTFTVPVREMLATPISRKVDVPFHQHDRPVVLVVEDEPSASKLLSIYLTEAGFAVEFAKGNQAGLDKVRNLQPALITLDILMPGIDGWDFLAYLKSHRETEHIPVVIVSILDEPGKGYALGAADYLVKPVNQEKVISAVRRTMSSAAALESLKTRILAIDDDPLVLDLIQVILGAEGFTVIKAAGGLEGIKLAREQNPDLIVLDLLMPEVDGFHVLGELKEDPLTLSIPIVVLTCKELTSEEKAFLNGRVSDLRQKAGLNRSDFVAQIRALLQMEHH